MKEHEAFEFSIIERVAIHAPVSLDDLYELFRDHSWNQLFATIDRLSRKGSLAISRVDRQTYMISLGPQLSTGTGGSPALRSSASSVHES